VSANTSTGGVGTTLYSTELLEVGYGTSFAVPTAPNVVISGGAASIAGGGGGAAALSPGPGGSGGLGGGGRGDWNSSFITNGTANTGGGGGGSRSHDEPSSGRDGGSGLVLLWYSNSASVFTPLTVSGIGLQVWLDGADPAGTGTAPADTASIATWTDKSGNGYNFTATSAATYSTTNRAPYFNNNYYTSTYTAAPVTETGFVVFKLNSTAAPQIIIGANNGGREVSVANTFGEFGIIKSQVAWGQTVSGLTNSTTTLSTWQITSQTNTYISLNGALSLSGPTSIGTFTNGVTTGLGREATASIPVYGWVMEIVMFNTQLSQTNQQKMEGYLAWKWGSQASLPAGHPHKSSAPTS
jgi:hypothetical protein